MRTLLSSNRRVASAGSLCRTCQSKLAQFCKHMTDFGSLLLWVGGSVSFAGYAVRGGKDDLILGCLQWMFALMFGIFGYLREH